MPDYEVDRDNRQQIIVASAAQTVFGPLNFDLLDEIDLVIEKLTAVAGIWDLVASSRTVAGVGPDLNPTVTFAVGRPNGETLRFKSARLDARALDVTQGGAIRSVQLERELQRFTKVNQEVRRDIDAEAARRAAGETVLQANIDAEAASRASADVTLQNHIDAEAQARAAAITAEASARAAADIAEAASRASADVTLQTNLDAEVATRAAAIMAEAMIRAAADVDADDRLDALESAVIGGGSFLAASQAEAEAGTSNVKGMTPLRTADAIKGFPFVLFAAGAERTITERLRDQPCVLDWDGSDPTAANDSLDAFQDALDGQHGVWLPHNSRFALDGELTLNDYNVLYGDGMYSQGATSSKDGPPKLLFTGTGLGAMIKSAAGSNLLHAGMHGLTISDALGGQYDQAWNLIEPVNFHMRDIWAEIDFAAGGGLKARKLSAGNTSWVNDFYNVNISLLAGGSGRPLDLDYEGSVVQGGAYVGGIGSLYIGIGMRFIGARFSIATPVGTFGLTIGKNTTSTTPVQVIGCDFDANWGGLLLDADYNDGLSGSFAQYFLATIVGNKFRSVAAGGFDIKGQNATGDQIIRGPTMLGNSHHGTLPTPIFFDPLKWLEVSVDGGAYVGGVDKLLYESRPVTVFAASGTNVSHTGTTAETAKVTKSVTGRKMGRHGGLRITLNVENTSSANNKTYRIKHGGTTYLEYVASTGNVRGELVCEIWNQNSESAQRGGPIILYGQGGMVNSAAVTGTVDTGQAQDVEISIELANAGETATIRRWAIEVLPAS